MRTILRAVLGAGTAALLAAASAAPLGAQQEKPPALVIDMTSDMQYRPYKAKVKAGETVEWKNSSWFTHTVTADPSLAKDKKNVVLPKGAETFNSGDIARNETFRYTFTVPGNYRYFCIPHENKGMVGEITVEPEE